MSSHFGDIFLSILSQKKLGKSANILIIETHGNMPTPIVVTIPTWRPMMSIIPRNLLPVFQNGNMRSSGARNSVNMLAHERNSSIFL
jgi:hypothetical protein